MKKFLWRRAACLLSHFKNIFLKFFVFLLQTNIFLVFLNYFNMLISKIFFKKLKIYILIHFWIKNTLKNNCYYTFKYPTVIIIAAPKKSKIKTLQVKANKIKIIGKLSANWPKSMIRQIPTYSWGGRLEFDGKGKAWF